jgi:hypothetical protein
MLAEAPEPEATTGIQGTTRCSGPLPVLSLAGPILGMLAGNLRFRESILVRLRNSADGVNLPRWTVRMMKVKTCARLLTYVTGLVNHELLLQNQYLAAENRILRSRLPLRLRLSDPERETLAEIGKRLRRKALTHVPCRGTRRRITRRWLPLTRVGITSNPRSELVCTRFWSVLLPSTRQTDGLRCRNCTKSPFL